MTAQEELVKAGYQCRIDKVLAIDMASDQPGTLNKILSNLSRANVFVKYCYISFDRETSSPIAVLKTDEPETETFLKGKGYRLLDRFWYGVWLRDKIRNSIQESFLPGSCTPDFLFMIVIEEDRVPRGMRFFFSLQFV